MAITITQMKSPLYIDKATSTSFDTEIQDLINDVSDEAIDYMDNEDITVVADFTTVIERALRIQINYEFRRRHDPGLSSVQYSDGSINKFSVAEWIPKVKRILDRNRPSKMTI
jgi:hypothetical protein